jgi:hypothetical protein
MRVPRSYKLIKKPSKNRASDERLRAALEAKVARGVRYMATSITDVVRGTDLERCARYAAIGGTATVGIGWPKQNVLFVSAVQSGSG